ncbi:MAG: PhoH family protein [Desulfovibrio sp.]
MPQKNYVLDTNVLIENPQCIQTLRNGAENNIFLPFTVLQELDGLKRDPRLGHIVSMAVNAILHDDKINFLHPDKSTGSGDDAILKEIRSHALDDPILVTNDKILRIKARLFNIAAEGYRDALPFISESQYITGFTPEDQQPAINTFQWEQGTPIFHGNSGPRAVTYQHQVWGVTPRNIYQNLALELLQDEELPLVSIQSAAGYGKTFLALAAALHLVLQLKDKTPYKKIYISKPVMEIGKGLGYLPGDVDEKMLPYIRYIHDLLFRLHDRRPANRLFLDAISNPPRFDTKRFEVLPIAYIRGMNIENAVVIIDEMQNLSRYEARALLTRMGEGVKCICLGDTRQVDNPYLNEHNNGLNWLVKKLNGHANYAHMVLKGERSRGPVTDMVLKCEL